MRTGRLQISRGCELAPAGPGGPKLSLVAAEKGIAAPPVSAQAQDEVGHQTMLARLEVLERLARLRSLELLSAEEYAAEKAFILSAHSQGRELPADAEKPLEAMETRGPSLASRLFSWKLLPISLIAGLAFSFGVQPQETIRFLDQALSQIGA
jgi:hypothetical protein